VSFAILISILISVCAALLTLVFRQVLVYLYIVASPIIVIMWILPNTQAQARKLATGGVKVVAMYPLIIGLFIAGQLAADTAGTLGGTNQNLTTFFALVALFAPLFLLPWTFKWAGAGMNLIANGVNKFGGQIDKRYGRDSDFAKNNAALREHNRLQRSKDAEDRGNRFAAAYHRSRSGTGQGLFGFTRGNKLLDQARHEKYEAARGTEAKINSRAQARRTPGMAESHTDALLAETLTATNDIAKARAARAGVLDAEREKRTTGVSTAEEAYKATRINTKRTLSADIGKNRGTITGERLLPQSGAVVGDEAEFREQGMQAMERGKIRRSVSTVRQIDANARARYGLSADQATYQRMATGAGAAGLQAREEISTLYGQQVQRVYDDAQPGGGETVAGLVAAGSLDERKRIQNAKALRQESLRVQATTRETSAQSRLAAEIHARDQAGHEYAERRALRTGEREAPETLPEQLESQSRQAEQSELDKLNARRELLQAEDEDADIRLPPPPAWVGPPGSASYNTWRAGERRRIATERRQQASRQTAFRAANTAVGNRTTVINDAAANPGLAAGTPGAGAQVRRSATFAEGKRLGAETGKITGNIEAEEAEANEAGLAPGSDAASVSSIQTATEASAISSGRAAGKAYADEKNLIEANRTNTVTAADVAEQTQRQGEIEQAAANQEVLSKLEEERAASARTGLPDRAARDQLMAQATTKKRSETRDATRTEYRETEAAVSGRRIAQQKEIDEGRAAPGDYAGAEENITERAASLAGQNKEREVSEGAAKNVGTEREREDAIEDEMDMNPGITRAQAVARLQSNDYDAARIGAGDTERKRIGDARGVSGSDESAINNYIRQHPGTSRAVALRRVRAINRAAAARTAGNARTGEAAKNRGIIESRERAVREEMDQGRALTEDEAYANLDSRADVTAYKQAGDTYNADIGKELGTTESYEEAVQNLMNTGISREEAEQRLAAATIQRNADEEGERVSEAIGKTDEGNVGAEADREAVTAEMLGLDVNNPAQLATVRTWLANAANRQVVERRMRRRSRLAGAEQGARDEAAKSGKTEALNQARNSPRRPEALDRRSAATQREIATAATEAAGVNAYNRPYIQERRYEDALETGTATQAETLLNQGVQEAAAGITLPTEEVLDPATGDWVPAPGSTQVRLKDLAQGGREREIVRRDVMRAMAAGDYYRALAGMDHLASGPSGSQEKLIRIAQDLFGRDDFRVANPDPAHNGLPAEVSRHALELYSRAIDKVKDNDIKLAPRVAYDNFGVDMLTGNSHRFDERAIGYISDPANYMRRSDGTTIDPLASPAQAAEAATELSKRTAHRRQAATAVGEIFNPSSPTKFDATRRAKIAQLTFARDPDGVILDAVTGAPLVPAGMPAGTRITDIFEKDIATGRYTLTDAQRADIAARAGVDTEMRDIIGQTAGPGTTGDEIVTSLRDALGRLRA
jgi:hypothetical protein